MTSSTGEWLLKPHQRPAHECSQSEHERRTWARSGSRTRVHCGFGVLDQRGLVKLNAIVQFVMDVYGRAMVAWTEQSRADYLRATGTGPVTAHAQITRWPHQLDLDDPLEVAAATDYGFVRGTEGAPPRYGGQDQFTFTDATGNVVAQWQQQWFHHHVAIGQLLHEPAPGIPTDQDRELARPPRRPRSMRHPLRRGRFGGRCEKRISTST